MTRDSNMRCVCPAGTFFNGAVSRCDCNPGLVSYNGGMCEVPLYQTQWTAWSACSADCGQGSQSRTLQCVRIDNGAEVAMQLCVDQERQLGNAVTATTQTQRCLIKPCATYAYDVGTFGTCSASCRAAGAAAPTMTRTVRCLKNEGDFVVEAPVSECQGSIGAAPASTATCNTQPCVTYEWRRDQSASATDCTNFCSQRGDVTVFFTFTCYISGTNTVVSGNNCPSTYPSAGSQVVTSCRTCTDEEYYANIPLVPISLCSQTCGTCQDRYQQGDRVVTVDRDFGSCFIYKFETGSWSSCTPQNADACVGTQTRTVTCNRYPKGDLTATPVAVDASFCGANVPAASRPCSIDCSCNAAAQEVCGQGTGRGQCVSQGNSRACQCTQGWTGPQCNTRVQQQQQTCASNVFNAAGACCASGVLDTNQACCAAGSVLDGQGQCCASTVDACGVCGGSGVIDGQGQCCQGQLDGQQLCCAAPQTVDAIGVCGGTGATAGVQMTLENTVCNALDNVATADLNDLSNPDVATCVELLQNSLSGGLQTDPANIGDTEYNRPSRRRRLQTFGSSVTTSVTLLPDPSSGFAPAQISSTEIAVKSSDYASTNYASQMSLPQTAVSVPVAVCGNGVCEFGEVCTAGSTDCCRADCPLASLPCPDDCSGRGVCQSLTADPSATVGTCQCFASLGFAGESCASCAPGFTAVGENCVSDSAPTCFDGVQNGEETGVDCGGICEECSWWGSLKRLAADNMIGAAFAFMLFVMAVLAVYWFVIRPRLVKKASAPANRSASDNQI